MRERVTSGKVYDLIFHVIIGSLFAWALSKNLLVPTILEVPYLPLFLYCAVFVLLLNLVFFSKRTALYTLGFLVLAAAAIFVYLIVQNFEIGWFLAIRETISDFSDFARNEIPYREQFSRLAGMGIAFLFSFVTVLNTRLHYGFITLSLVAAGVIIVPMYMGWGGSDSAIMATLFCLLAMLAKRLYLNALRGQGAAHGFSRYALILLPLCLLIFGVGWILPKPDAETLDNLDLPNVGAALDRILHTIGPEQTISFTDNSRRLGGPANLNDLVVMIVEADERLYLAGAIRDYYTGDAWINTVRGRTALTADENGVFPTDNIPEGLRRAHGFFQRYYAWPTREVTITTGDARTDIIFTPPFSQTLEMDIDTPVYQDVYGNLRSGRILPWETSYTLSYISWNYTSPHFSHVLREFAAARGYQGFNQDELSPFLQLPDSLPERVGDLARELTAGLYNNYDRLRVLERFLASFTYTLDAEYLPEGEDFVDHFLFTAREGYCVHFASAMVIMARTLGIPARYVEGYILPALPTIDGRFWVTNQYAHAWVEAYFEGFGWVKFEPTPTYNVGGGDIVLDIPEDDYEYQVYVGDEDEDEHEEGDEDDDYVPVYAGADPDEEPDEPGGGFPIWGVLLILAALAGVGYLAYRRLTARYRLRQHTLENLPNREAVVALFASVLNAAQACGHPISPGETALVYAGRNAEQPIFTGQGVDIRQLAGIYSKAAYSGHDVTTWERAAAQKARDCVLRSLTASRKNLPRYWVERYVLLLY